VLVVALDRRHHLALRRERDLADALETPLAPRGDAQLALGHQEGCLGGIAVDLPFAARPPAQIGIAGQAAAAEHHDVLVAQRPRFQFGAFVLDLSLRRVPNAGDARAARGGDHPLDGHLRPGQGPGLVRADHRRRPQRLHGRQVLDDGVVLCHPLHAHGQHHRQDRRQPLGHGRHRQRHAEQQDGDDIGGAADVGDQQDGAHHHDGDDDDRDAQHAPDASDFLLERCRLLGSGLEHLCDRSHLGVHPGGRDDGATSSLGDGRALEDHV
jgi:hypothetical protein